MERRHDTLAARYGAALLGSVLLHAAVFAGLGGLLDWSPPDAPPARPIPARPIPILSEEEVEQLIALAQKHPPPKLIPPEEKPEAEKPPEPKKPEPDKPTGQVVEIPPPPREEVPDDARLLSDYNSKVDKEMVAATVRPPNPRMVKSDRRLLSPGDDENGRSSAPKRKRADSTSPRVGDRPGDAERPGPTPGPAPQPGETAPRKAEPRNDPLVEGDGPFKPSIDQARAPEARPGGGGTVGGTPAEPQDWTALLPTLGPEDLARQDGSIDHIEDMEKGDQTFLNTREYQYAWFFNRVKRQVQRRWHAVEAHRRHDPYGRVYGVRDRQTVVEVTLDPEGALEEIIITADSGVAFLDEAAVAAFQDASPFPNPPEGLKDPDGRIRFRFAFFLEINSRGLRFLPRRPPP